MMMMMMMLMMMVMVVIFANVIYESRVRRLSGVKILA